MRRLSCAALCATALMLSITAVAEQGKGVPCTLAGVWYGGSVVAYRITITPAGPAGHYQVLTEGMYKNAVMTTMWSGQIEKHGKQYVGTMSALNTQDPAYNGPPPFANLPDIAAGWFTFELLNCNTMKSTIPFLGLYFGPGIWQPGTPWSGINWLPNAKVPMQDPPDVDLIPVLTGDVKPIVETYHRVSRTVNASLLHK